ncbi:MAG: hypothetical protein HYZ34_14605 [Ignavibacteriae bacterium]|nr:hypothetical protein [Ignavibacteriota bacterium]
MNRLFQAAYYLSISDYKFYAMYCIKFETEGKSQPIISMEGRLDAVRVIEKQLADILLGSLHESKNIKEVLIDLEKVEFISEDCLKMFERVQQLYPIKFRGYSLFNETKLREHSLLSDLVNS